ncbi:MAG: chitinase [Deltaproteobacteria bacterium]|nr:chitinase [Deltaproteobacteria bacterium]
MRRIDTLRNWLFVLSSSAGIACVFAGEARTEEAERPAAAAEDPAADETAAAANDDEIAQRADALSCGATTWQQGKWYPAGAVVYYSGRYYVATNANPGYHPTISTWYWSPKSGCTTTSTCNASAWQQGKWYSAGAVVGYGGKYYVATYGNPGYDPTISTWYWSPKTCSTTSTTSATSATTTSTSTGSSAFERIVSRATFNAIFPDRASFYTYDGLVRAAKIYPRFASSGTVTTQKREVAAFLANVTHETAALVYVEQIVKDIYCGYSSGCACVTGKRYFGRGPLQLSWNGNYCDASEALFGDGDTLRRDPDRVAREAWVAWGTGLWFWMSSSGAGRMTAHDAIVGGAGFGETIRTINGAQECYGGYPAGVTSRVNAYKRICSLLGVTPGYGTTC